MMAIIKDKNESNLVRFYNFFSSAFTNQMDMQQPQMDYEEEEYQSTSLSSDTDLFSELLLATSDQKFIDIIIKMKNDKEKFISVFNTFNESKQKKKALTYLKKIQTKVAQLLVSLKQNDKYFQTESQKSVFWFLNKFFGSEIIESNQQILKSLRKISSEFTSYQDFLYLSEQANEMRMALRKNIFNSAKLNYLYHEQYDKLQNEKTPMKFAETMKNLDEQKKLIIKAEIIGILNFDISNWRIQGSQMQNVLNVLVEKPYFKLLESVLNKKIKSTKNFRSLILKSKLQVKDGKSQIVFGPKCEIHNDLKTKQTFELTAKKSDGSELIPQFDTEALLVHNDYLYIKWSQDIVISAKEKVSFESSTQGLNEGFIKLLSFFKKLFEHRNKHIRFLGSESKMIEEGNQQITPKQTVEYICHTLQLLVKYLSFNSIQINHREQNLGDLIPLVFLEELLKFFQGQLQSNLALLEDSKEIKDDKKPKNIVIETIDYLVSLSAHLFYRRDFQSITAFTSKVSQSLLKILLLVPNFPFRWAVLRNYKLVVDRWSESVPQGSQDYKLLAQKFLQSFFNEKVTVVSKSSSTVFNPIFLTRAYCKIFGVELLKFVESLEKQLDEYDAKTQSSNVAQGLNSKVSKVILFMSTRVRYSESNKIAEHLSNIYRKYAHIVPEIYLFRSWIAQLNFTKCNQTQISTKLNECLNLIDMVSQKIKGFDAKTLLTPVCNLNQEEFSQTLQSLNLYKICNSRVMNSLQIKPKTEQLGQQVLKSLIQMTKKHVEVFYGIYMKGKQFQSLQKQTHDLLREQNQLYSRSGKGSILVIVQQIKKNILALVRYFICNADKILTTKDYSIIVGALGSWITEFVTESDKQKEKDNEKLSFVIRNLNILIGLKLPLGFNCHLMKNQILGTARAINGAEQLGLKKNEATPFNEVIAFYEQIKPIYSQFIKMLIEIKVSENTKSKNQNQLNQACNQILEYSIFPNTSIAGPCNFNGKLQNKSTESMVLGVFLEQAQILSKNFSIDEYLLLNEKYSLTTMLKITQDKQSKITQQKAGRPNQGGIFVGMRSNRDRTQIRNQLMQYGYTEDQIQIALENIGVPDAQAASQWIQNNQQTIYNMLVQKAIKQSKQQTMMKQKVQTKIQVGKISPIDYSQFKDKLKQSMDNLVKTLWKQLFDHDIQKGKKMTDLVFVIIDAFKDKYKTNQYINFSKKMFSEIQAIKQQIKKPQYKFEDKKYRLILYILNFTLKREPQVYKNYYKDKDGICLKVLEFVGLFGNGFKDEVQRQKERSEDFSQLLQIVNRTLPEWKSPLQQVKPQLVEYLSCLLDLINISNLGNKDVWQILYKISSLQLPQLREKIISLFSNIILSKHILDEQREKLKQQNKVPQKEKRNIFYKAPKKSLSSKLFMLPLIKILLEQDKQLLVSNIELEIKRYIGQVHRFQLKSKNKQQKGKKEPLAIDLKKFSNAFEKFIGCADFQKVFKKLFTKKKNMKGVILYDFTKHPLFLSELADEKTQQSFISLKFNPLIEQILQTLISRVLQFGDEERQLQQEALISLYKFLDHFKVLIPTALRTQFINPKTSKLTTLLEWIICDSIALNEKKYHFMTFLTMTNHLLINQKQSIADWVCSQYLAIFTREIGSFSQYMGQKKEKQMVQNTQSENGFKEETFEEINFKKIMFNFMYLLQVDRFNSQCFLKTVSEQSVREQIQGLFIHINPTQQPIIYTLISEIIFILRKREMIELLKQKYELHSPQIVKDQNQTVNLNKSQFLDMSLIYNVQQPMIGDNMQALKSSRRRNIFSGSSGRIVVDQIQDQEDEESEMNWDQMQAHGDFYDEIGDLVGLRARQRAQGNSRSDGIGESFLFPNEMYRLANQPVLQQINNNAQQQQQSQQQSNEVNNEPQQEKTQKIEEQKPEQLNEKKQEKPMSQFDYSKMLKQQSQRLIETIKNVQSLLPQLRYLGVKSKSEAKIQQQSQEKMISQEQDLKNAGTDEFLQSLTKLIENVKEKTSLIIPANTHFNPSSDINPEFFCRLALKDSISKLVKFDKRFKSMIITFCPQVKLNIWENDHGAASSRLSSSQMVRQIPNARWLLSRLEREENRETRDRMLHSIESIFNFGRENRRQEDTRPRTLNLNQAVQALPEQPQPPKEQQKLKSQEKQPEKQKSQEKVEVRPQQNQGQENKISQLPVQQKIVEEKPQQKQQEKMQEQKPVVQQSDQKVQEKPVLTENQMNIEQQKPVQPEQIIPQEPLVQQPQVDVQLPQQVMAETGPYREILAMFGLSQTFLADNGIDTESFDALPQELQIDQITHYMNQAQNRMAINQLNQANQPVQQNANQQQPGQNENVSPDQQNQGGNSVNEVLQQNIALFASMDPETRMQMLADYPPQFLMQLPVQMRTQVQQYRQRQLRRFASSEEEENQFGVREALINPANRKKDKNLKDLKQDNVIYPSPQELNFNPVADSLAQHLAKSIFLKVEKTPMINGFRFLLQNYLTQQRALATIVGILNIDDGLKSIQLQKDTEQINKKDSQKSEKSIIIPKKSPWKCQNLLLTDAQQINNLKQTLLNIVLDTLNENIYKNPDFLMKKVPFGNYLHLSIEPQKELEADQNGFWPLYELLPYSLNLCPKLSVQILKRVKSLPLKLIKSIVQAIRLDKLSPEIYKNLQLLSKNEDMKRLFMEEFPEERPLKLETFAKIIKYEFARVPYLKKLHQQALNYYNAEYNQFLNQIFGIYTIEDIKEIQSILIKHKNVHFQVIKYLYSQNRVLDKQPMGLILKMPHLLDFETKKYLFRKHPKIRRASRYRLPIEVSRTNILQESFNQIMSKTPKQLEGRLQITFMDEQGYDAGGLTRQWLLCLSREIFNPNYGLFEPSSSGNTYQPNPKSYINPDHLQYFKFIGRFVGKALAENELVDAYFTRAFYKMVLGQQIELSDLEQQDYSFYKSMLWLKQNPIEEGDYTFSYLYDNFGQRIVKDLIPGGRDINVNEGNKQQYIEKYCLAKMRDDFKVQIEKFLQGFHEIVPHECINFFEAKQLELLISGLPEINFEDLRNNVDYSGFSPTDQAIKWFWQILEEFTQEDLARLIQFITGTSKIPVDGFANIKGMNGPQRISIHKDPNSHQLPKAHTCFNQLDLPNYDTKEIMRERIVTAITWGSEGFGFM